MDRLRWLNVAILLRLLRVSYCRNTRLAAANIECRRGVSLTALIGCEESPTGGIVCPY